MADKARSAMGKAKLEATSPYAPRTRGGSRRFHKGRPFLQSWSGIASVTLVEFEPSLNEARVPCSGPPEATVPLFPRPEIDGDVSAASAKEKTAKDLSVDRPNLA